MELGPSGMFSRSLGINKTGSQVETGRLHAIGRMDDVAGIGNEKAKAFIVRYLRASAKIKSEKQSKSKHRNGTPIPPRINESRLSQAAIMCECSSFFLLRSQGKVAPFARKLSDVTDSQIHQTSIGSWST